MKKRMAVAVLVLSMGAPVALAGNKTPNMQGQQNPESGQASAPDQARPQGPTDQEMNEPHPENTIREAQAPGSSSGSTNQQMTGSIKSASATAIELTPPGNRADMRFRTNPQTKVTRDAKAASFADLKRGDQVRITYEQVKSERTLRSVDILRASARVPATGAHK